VKHRLTKVDGNKAGLLVIGLSSGLWEPLKAQWLQWLSDTGGEKKMKVFHWHMMTLTSLCLLIPVKWLLCFPLYTKCVL